MFERHNRPFQRDLQNFIHDFYEVYRKAREDFLRDVRQVLLIILRKYDCAQAHSVSGEKFFFYAADGENFAAQGDFAGHSEVAANGIAGERADDGGADGDAGGGAVFGDGAFGHVHVNVDVAIEIFGQAEVRGARPNIGHGGLRGFLHDVAEFSGESEAAFAFHERGFGDENGAADFGPREAGGEADFVLLFEPELAVLQNAEEIVDVGWSDFRGRGGPSVTTLRAILRPMF